MYAVLLSIYIQCCIWSVAHTQDPVVETKYGGVSGESVVLADGTVIDSFLGIPFARPPVGELRFAPPEEPEPWEDTLSATELGDACLQRIINAVQRTHRGFDRFTENCLHLNVYSPQREDPTELLPVLVWIHGGDFQAGANFVYPGYFLAQKEVVVVSINYRLGIMGFAFSGDGVIPGNNGLADQILALTFVQENIEEFGGDPNRVTIFGESAGGASVGFLLMSPQATGLFHAAILQSGSEFAEWALYPPGMQPETYIVQVAEGVNCPVDSSEEMLACLRDIDGGRLDRQRFNCTEGYTCGGGFRPVVDGLILPDTPDNIRASGEYNQVPEMIGINEDEISVFLVFDPNLDEDGLNRTQFDAYLEREVGLVAPRWTDPSREEDVIQAFRFFYADWPYFDDIEKNRDMLVDLETDNSFGRSADKQAKLHSQDGSDVYYYIYDYVSDYSERPEWLGAYHGIEISYVFGWPFMHLEENAYNHSQTTSNSNYSLADAQFSDFVMTMWTNFAKFNNPTGDTVISPGGAPVSWDRFTHENLTYLNIAYEPVQDKDYRQKEYAFWAEYLQYLTDGIPFADSFEQYWNDWDEYDDIIL